MNNGIKEMKRSQYMMLLAGFIMGSYLLLSFVTNLAEHDIWLVILAGFLLSIPLLICFTALSKRFPDQDLIQILETVYGKILGNIIAVLYFLFFLMLLSFNLHDIAAFYIELVLIETPQAILVMIFGLLCAYVAGRGMAALAKTSLIISIISLFIAVITTLLLVDKMDFGNFLPVFDIPVHTFVQSTSIFIMLPFGDAIALLMVMPMVKNKTKLHRYTISAMFLALLVYMIPSIRNISVLGASSLVYNQAAYQAARMVNIADIVSRIELTVTLAITLVVFVKICVLYYSATKGISQILHLNSYKTLLLPIGAIALALALVDFPSTVFETEWGLKYTLFFNAPFGVIFPLLTLIIAKIRKFSSAVIT